MSAEAAPLPRQLCAGLRFRKGDARVLRVLAERVKRAELGTQHVATFEQAAQAAASGEPLIVYASDPMEFDLLADGYVRWGVKRPAIEELSGKA